MTASPLRREGPPYGGGSASPGAAALRRAGPSFLQKRETVTHFLCFSEKCSRENTCHFTVRLPLLRAGERGTIQIQGSSVNDFFHGYRAVGARSASSRKNPRASLLLGCLEMQHLTRVCREPEVLYRGYPLPFPFKRVVQSDASSVTGDVCPSSSMHRTSTGGG